MNQHNVLYLEDAWDMQKIVSMVLRRKGMEVKAAVTAFDAYKMMDEGFHPDVLLMDLTIPDSDPKNFVKNLRERFTDISPTLVVISGRDDIANVAHEIGAATFLKKPFDVEDLSLTISAVLEARNASDI